MIDQQTPYPKITNSHKPSGDLIHSPVRYEPPLISTGARERNVLGTAKQRICSPSWHRLYLYTKDNHVFWNGYNSRDDLHITTDIDTSRALDSASGVSFHTRL